ncbi:helix-turn-helix domain-containing protein [Alishewanella sp. HL-SH06]|uniref:helix-turn-helix domain-containing protein n=1 Tax=Alishewanella sp. HL-SH06 TaxID=3461144 RepID=UPI0040430234
MSNNPFPKRLKEARIAKELSQRKLGHILGFGTTASSRMNQYEQGSRVPDFETLEKIAKELDVPVAYFFCSSDKLAELVKIFGNLPESDQEKLLEQIRSSQNKPLVD